ncbi:alcohol oxidase [Cyathus striatus]|nr:alcohol oxidase [Cyathus striatus]
MARGLHSLLYALVTLAVHSNALIYEKLSDLPNVNKYDYVVVGGGTAGGVIANRLSEDRDVRVLVLEAGATNRGKPEVTVPYLMRLALGDPSLDWNTTLVPQPELNERVLGYTRGHILGGSSSINGMVYTRGTKEDYDRYARLTGDDGWSWDSLQPYIKRNEKFFPTTADGFNATGRFNPTVHNYNGVAGTSVNAWPMDTDDLVLKVTEEAPEEFPFTLDYNSGIANGVGWTQYLIGNGTRSSSAWTYLGDKYITRSNLHVLVGAKVSRVLQSTRKGAIDTVEFTHTSRNGTIYAKVSQEIILSAGAAGSPHILLNSGIGDATELSALKIPVVADIPSVGKNFSEQTLVPNTRWKTRSTDTFQHILENATLADEAYAQWNKSRTGPYAAGGINQYIWLRMNESDPEYGDPAAGPLAPHFEITPSVSASIYTPMSEPLMDVSPIALYPLSRGSLTLNASDPFGQPVINGSFYTHPMDMFVQKQAIITAIRFVNHPAFSEYVIEPFPEIAAIIAEDGSIDDAALENFIRNNTLSNIHAVGTASMSACGADWGVVDPDLKVKGLKGLRVVDTSVMPYIALGAMAPVYIIAERASDLIKETYACDNVNGLRSVSLRASSKCASGKKPNPKCGKLPGRK